jgi:flagellar biosynthetic protein FliQ
MEAQEVIAVANRMLWTAFLLSMPLLLTALTVGVLVSLVQTVTGVQEMTLTFVPKIISVLVALVVFLPWMASVLTTFTQEVFLYIAGG